MKYDGFNPKLGMPVTKKPKTDGTQGTVNVLVIFIVLLIET